MTLIATTYCTEADLNRLLSASGVIAFADHDQDDAADTGVVDDCINQASQEIDAYALQRYDATGLASSNLINRWCTTMAAYFLCIRRNNPIAESLALEFNRIADPDNGLLVRLAAGTYKLPGVALSADLSPSFSNLKIDRRWPHSRVRVTRANSSSSPTTLTRDDSYEYPVTDG